MSEITDRELTLAQLKSIDDIYDVKSLKPIIKNFEEIIKENKAARKVMKKIEIKFWPPKITIEWEFPFRNKK